MKPIFTKFGDTKIYSFFSNTLPSLSASTNGRSSQGRATPTQKPSRKHYKIKNSATEGVFGTTKEMQAWPSAVSTTPGSPDSNMHRFVDNKAAQIMFNHTSANTGTNKPGSPNVDAITPPKPPPKSKYYSPDKRLGEEGDLGIVVKRDWDVEKGEGGNSDEMDRQLLREGRYGRPW